MKKRDGYPRFRDSGVKWLGEVPGHWDVKRLAYSVLRADVKLEPEQAEGLPYVGLEHVASWTGRLLPLDDQLTPEGAANAFESGDVLFGKLRPYLAKALCPDFGGVCSTEFLVLKPRDYERRYLLYLLLTDGFVSYVDSSTYGAKMPRANWEFIGDSLLPVPPLDEQRDIADFLDRETERIDLLIAKKRLLIERLREYRTALITRSVTRGLPSEAACAAGLDPSPRLKPSGVEWLGDVPAHWEVARLGLVTTYRTSSVDKKTEEGERPVKLCNYTDVYYRERIRADQEGLMAATASPREIDRFRLRVGDVLITKDSEDWQDIGVPALVEEAAYDFLCGYHLGIIRPGSRIEPEMLLRIMQSPAVNRQLQVSATGITRYGLPNAAVANALIPIPPLSEQRAIAEFLDRQLTLLTHIAAAATTAMERLQEYRTALIAAAVTGKVDVRDAASSDRGSDELPASALPGSR